MPPASSIAWLSLREGMRGGSNSGRLAAAVFECLIRSWLLDLNLLKALRFPASRESGGFPRLPGEVSDFDNGLDRTL